MDQGNDAWSWKSNGTGKSTAAIHDQKVPLVCMDKSWYKVEDPAGCRLIFP